MALNSNTHRESEGWWFRARLVCRVVPLLMLAACTVTVTDFRRRQPPVKAIDYVRYRGSVARAPKKSPCEIAAELRKHVPRLLNEGKLHRTGRIIEKANGLCPGAAKETWAAEVEVAAALGTPGKYTNARRIINEIRAATNASESPITAAIRASDWVDRFDKEWPPPDKVTPAMRKAYADAELAASAMKLDEAIALYEKAYEAWPLNGIALMSAGALAKKQGRSAEAQRFFDRSIAVMEGRAGAKVMVEVPNGFAGIIRAISWSPNGKRLVAVHGSNAVSIFDTDSWQVRARLEGDTAAPVHSVVHAVAFSPDAKRLVSGSSDHTVTLWDTDTRSLIHAMKGHTDSVFAVAFSPDGKRLASGSRDHKVRTWDATTGKPLLVLDEHSLDVMAVAFSPDGKRLATASYDHTVRTWDAATGKPILVLKGHTDGVRAVAFSPNGKTIVSGANDHKVRTWDAATGKPILIIPWHTDDVNTVAFSPDGKRIVSGSYDHTVRMWDATGRPLLILDGHDDIVSAVAFSSDGTQVASGSVDETVQLWDATTGTRRRTLERHTADVLTLALSPDGKRIGSDSDDNTVRLWDAVTGAHVCVLEGHTSGVVALAFSPDGKYVASGASNQSVRLWDAATGIPLHVLPGHTDSVNVLAFSQDSKRLSARFRNGMVKLWNVETGQTLLETQDPTAAFAEAVSPDGKQFASISVNGTLGLRNAAMAAPLRTLTGHTDVVTSVEFSPHWQILASGSKDKTVRLWDPESGKLFGTLQGHTARVKAVAFLPNSKHMLSASEDNELRLWHLPEGSLVAILRNVADKKTIYHITPAGHIDFLGADACHVRDKLARCRIGPYSVPFEVCEERFYTPGLLANLVAEDSSYLEPEFEATRLVCGTPTSTLP